MSSSTIETRMSRFPGNLGSWRAALTSPIKRGIAWIASRRRRRRDLDELMALDDRMLRDIGLSRSEIEYAVRYGQPFDRADDSVHP